MRQEVDGARPRARSPRQPCRNRAARAAGKQWPRVSLPSCPATAVLGGHGNRFGVARRPSCCGGSRGRARSRHRVPCPAEPICFVRVAGSGLELLRTIQVALTQPRRITGVLRGRASQLPLLGSLRPAGGVAAATRICPARATVHRRLSRVRARLARAHSSSHRGRGALQRVHLRD
jgi:hypothetical protein